MKNVVVIDYGSGNIRSVVNAFERLGAKVLVSGSADEIKRADKVIFPGVGHAQSAMEALKAQQLDQLIPSLKQPVLGICLGMQLMCAWSEEGGNTRGLGIFDATVRRFKTNLKVPHMGWNTLGFLRSHPLLKGIPEQSYMYFVHTFYVPVIPHTVASCGYDDNFSAILVRDNFFGCQFHPEKSGEPGRQLLKNFLEL